MRPARARRWARGLALTLGAIPSILCALLASEDAAIPARGAEDLPLAAGGGAEVTARGNLLDPRSLSGNVLDSALGLGPPLALEKGFRLEIGLGYLHGPAEGLLQTPRGGFAGTTSPSRPTLDEIGIRDATIFDAALSLGWIDSEVYLGAQLVRLEGDDVLEEDLLSQGTTFPAGSPVDARVKLDWYRAGFEQRFSLLDPRADSKLLLCPRVGLAVLDYRFELDGPGSAEVDRSITKACPQVGLRIEWRITRAFTISGGALVSIPIEALPLIVSAEVLAKYGVVRTPALDVSLVLGAGYERIALDDRHKQTVANDIEVDLGPLLHAGVEFALR